METISKSRNKYQQRTNIQLRCRVCLTLSNNVMFNLDNESIAVGKNVSNYPEEISVREALEKVTSFTVPIKNDCPQHICPICLSFLKMSLKFIIQFEESQEKLNVGICKSSLFTCDKNSKSAMDESRDDTKSSSVEVIFGDNKFSLNELIVVDKGENEHDDFNGFLKNLGSEVTATFIDKNKNFNVQNKYYSEEISIALRENDKLFTIKEVRLNEETDEIEYFVDDLDVKQQKEITNEPFEDELLDTKIHAFILGPDENVEKSVLDQKYIDSFIITTDNKKDKNKDTAFSRQIGKLRHNKRKKKIGCYPCDVCKKIHNTATALKEHQKNTHFNGFICEICGYINNTFSGHKHHMNKHFGKKWLCEICNKRYYTKAVLKVHMESHQNKRQFLCSVCGKNFNYSTSLIYHMRLHTGEKNYQCHICEQRYRMPNGLKRHILTHTGEKNYKCKYCGKSFYSKSENFAHELIHTDYRPYHCAYCNKGFIKSHNMKVHWLGHSGKYKCEMCAKSFLDLNILSFHYRFSHKIKKKSEYEVSDTEQQFERNNANEASDTEEFNDDFDYLS